MASSKPRAPSLLESIALGGASCVFTVNFVHPIELVKTRMQVSGNGLVRFSSNIPKFSDTPVLNAVVTVVAAAVTVVVATAAIGGGGVNLSRFQ